MQNKPVTPPTSLMDSFFADAPVKVYAKSEHIPVAAAYYQIISGHVGLYESEKNEYRKLLFIYGATEVFPYPHQQLQRESGNDLAFCALDTVQVRAIAKTELEQAINQRRELCHELSILLADRLNLAYERISDLENVGVADRLKKRLIFFARRFGVAGNDRVVIDVPLTHADIALSIGTTRETVNRVMRQFQKEGILQMVDRKIVMPRSIVDP